MNGMERRGRGAHFLRASGPAFFVCRLRLRGFCDSFSLCLSFLRFLENFIFSLRRAYPFGALRRPQALAFLLGAFVIPLPFLKILLFPFDALGPRGGPLLSAPAESRQRQAQGSFTPLRIPGPKWGAGRPPLETPKSRSAIRIGRTPRRFAAGASVPLGKAASACALATAAAPPPLRVWGLRPLAPYLSRWGTFAGHAHLLGVSPPGPRVPQREKPADHARSAWYRVRQGLRATPSQISRKLLPRSG